MRQQAKAFIDKSTVLLEDAATMLRVGLNEHAGRTAYLAGYHAAQALLFERTGKIFKTHSGVQGEFGRLTKGETRFGQATRAFLGRTYDLKAVADYETGLEAKLTGLQAAEAVDAARQFVECVARELAELDRRTWPSSPVD